MSETQQQPKTCRPIVIHCISEGGGATRFRCGTFDYDFITISLFSLL